MQGVSKVAENVLITGASMGIGREFARIYARRAATLVLVARSADTLAAVQDELLADPHLTARIVVIAADLSQPGAAHALFAECEKRCLHIDTLINNAGFGAFGPFADSSIATVHEMITVNIMALTELTHLALTGMRERGSGQILQVASTAAFQPGPLLAVYYATKAYVLSFAAALSHELQGSGVSITTLCPGPTRTAFDARANRRRSTPYAMDAASVARSGYAGLNRGRLVVIPGLRNRVSVALTRFLPRRLLLHIVHALQRRSTLGSPQERLK